MESCLISGEDSYALKYFDTALQALIGPFFPDECCITLSSAENSTPITTTKLITDNTKTACEESITGNMSININPSKGFEYLSRADAAGIPSLMLARCYEHGIGVRQDLLQAMHCYKKVMTRNIKSCTHDECITSSHFGSASFIPFIISFLIH